MTELRLSRLQPAAMRNSDRPHRHDPHRRRDSGGDLERADGVPLFLEELPKQSWKELPESGRIGTTGARRFGGPATSQSSLLARLDRLGPTAGEVAQARGDRPRVQL